MQEIIPKIKLGDFNLEDSINKVLSIIKEKGELYKQSDIIIGSTHTDALYISLPLEGIKMRFNAITQRLELIEKVFINNYNAEYTFNHTLVFSTKNKEHIYYSKPNYSYINSIFGISKMPKIINDGKNILLPYYGIAFIFANSVSISKNEIDNEALLLKMILFKGNNIIDSIGRDYYKIKSPNPLMRYNCGDVDKGISFEFITNKSNNDNISTSAMHSNVNIAIGDSLEEVLFKLKNPNYVHEIPCDNGEQRDFYLNYYQYGIDILIDGNVKGDNGVKRIILHTNNPFDSKFGIYERCNFIIEMNRSYLCKSFENEDANINTGMNNLLRKLSDDYEGNTECNVKLGKYDIEKGDSINLIGKIKEIEDKKKKVESSIDLTEIKEDINIKEINNQNDMFNSIMVFPWSDFNELLRQIPKDSYSQYQRHNNKINRMYKYYLFDDVVFEVLENGAICSVIITK